MPSFRAQLTNFVLHRFMKGSMRRFDDPLQLRRRMARLDALVRIPRRVSLQEQDAKGVPALWVSVPGADRKRIILYFHGGGFVTRSPSIHGRLLARLCQGLGATGFMPHYRLAPAHPYPAATDDCLTAYRWLLSCGYAARDIVIMGDSAGGCLSLVTVSRALEEGLPTPGCAVLMSPATDLTFHGASIESNEIRDPVASREGFELVGKTYLNGEDPTDPHISPLFGTFEGFPPLLFQAGSTEMLLDDSVRAAKKATAVGGQAVCEIWEKVPHVFQSLAFLPESRQAIHHIVEFVRLHTNWPR